MKGEMFFIGKVKINFWNVRLFKKSRGNNIYFFTGKLGFNIVNMDSFVGEDIILPLTKIRIKSENQQYKIQLLIFLHVFFIFRREDDILPYENERRFKQKFISPFLSKSKCYCHAIKRKCSCIYFTNVI